MTKEAEVVQQALQGIGKALEKYRTATGYTSDPGPPMGSPNYDPNARYQMNAEEHIYAERSLGLTETIIGAALVIAQEHIGKQGTTKAHGDIRTLANFWKHRDEWGLDWTKAFDKKGKRYQTCVDVENMGETAPMTADKSLGQLTRLAEKVLGKPFTTAALWDAISSIP